MLFKRRSMAASGSFLLPRLIVDAMIVKIAFFCFNCRKRCRSAFRTLIPATQTRNDTRSKNQHLFLRKKLKGCGQISCFSGECLSTTCCSVHMVTPGAILRRAWHTILPALRAYRAGTYSVHFSKLFDIHMMCWGSGRERTEEEYASLLKASDWHFVTCHYPLHGSMGVVEGLAT